MSFQNLPATRFDAWSAVRKTLVSAAILAGATFPFEDAAFAKAHRLPHHPTYHHHFAKHHYFAKHRHFVKHHHIEARRAPAEVLKAEVSKVDGNNVIERRNDIWAWFANLVTIKLYKTTNVDADAVLGKIYVGRDGEPQVDAELFLKKAKADSWQTSVGGGRAGPYRMETMVNPDQQATIAANTARAEGNLKAAINARIAELIAARQLRAGAVAEYRAKEVKDYSELAKLAGVKTVAPAAAVAAAPKEGSRHHIRVAEARARRAAKVAGTAPNNAIIYVPVFSGRGSVEYVAVAQNPARIAVAQRVGKPVHVAASAAAKPAKLTHAERQALVRAMPRPAFGFG